MANEEKKAYVPAREIGVITAEIRDLCRQAQTMALLYAVEIGRRLEEAKSALPYGEWGKWLKNEVEFSQSTANNFMRLFEEYGSAQISIFGASVDSQTFANLPYSKALQLLAVPKEEREEFAKSVGAADLSVSELKKAIAERDSARAEAEKERKAAEEALARENELCDRLSEAEGAIAEAEERKAEAIRLKKEFDEVTKALEDARSNAKALQEKLKKAEEDPKIPKKVLDKVRKEADEAAKKVAEAESGKELEAIKAALKAAETEKAAAERLAAEAKGRLSAVEKQLKVANPEVAAFKALFDSMQAMAGTLKGKIATIRQSDAEVADRLAAALKAFGASL